MTAYVSQTSYTPKKKKKHFLASNNHCEQLTAIALGADET